MVILLPTTTASTGLPPWNTSKRIGCCGVTVVVGLSSNGGADVTWFPTVVTAANVVVAVVGCGLVVTTVVSGSLVVVVVFVVVVVANGGVVLRILILVARVRGRRV